MSLGDTSGNVSEDEELEDPDMLMRDPKEWKVRASKERVTRVGARPLRSPRTIEIPV